MRRTIRSAAALALCAAFFLAGCAREGVDYVDVTEDIADSFPFEAEPVKENPQQAPESNVYAVFHTTAGDITVMLYPKETPDEVARFIEQAKAGAYDGQQFVYVRRDGLIESDNVAVEDAAAPEGKSTSENTLLPQSTTSSDVQSAAENTAPPGQEQESGSAPAQKTEGGEAAGPASGSTASSGATGGASGEAASSYTRDELDAVELPSLPQNVQGAHYSDNLHHYYGAVGISRKNEDGGDRLHFVVEQTKPEDERLVPVTLYMRRLINQRLAQLNALTQQQPFTDIQLAAFEARLNEEVQALSDGVIPEEYAERYGPINEVYSRVGGQWGLDYQYPLIGQIVEGQNVADAISQAKVDAQTRKPKQDIVIEYVEIVEP